VNPDEGGNNPQWWKNQQQHLLTKAVAALPEKQCQGESNHDSNIKSCKSNI